MKLYLYLNEIEYVDVWVNGGEIPVNSAKKYLSDLRDGVFTPDETRIIESNTPNFDISKFIKIEKGASISKILIKNSTFVFGDKIYKNVNYTNLFLEALILCFSTELSGKIATKLKKKACVEIVNISELQKYLDKQIEIKSIKKKCQYTDTIIRNYFLKSDKDEWQKEYRFIWVCDKDNVTCNIPPNMAIDVTQKLELNS